MKDNFAVEPDRTWFFKNTEYYLSREDFKQFSYVAGVNLRDLVSKDRETIKTAQENICCQARMFNELRKEHSGFGMPLLYYTHDLDNFAEDVSKKNDELETLIFSLDMADSLRRRHLALSHLVLPEKIKLISNFFDRPITINNAGSGIGLDVLNALCKTNGYVAKVNNYDINETALNLGKKITENLENDGLFDSNVNQYLLNSITQQENNVDIVLMIGVICGMSNKAALTTLKTVQRILNKGGAIIVSSSNHNMRNTDPLTSYLIQNIGTSHDPYDGWGLNCRTKDCLVDLLQRAGFNDIEVYDDSIINDYKNLKYAVDPLATNAVREHHSSKPTALPPEKTLDSKIGYNYIAIAQKNF